MLSMQVYTTPTSLEEAYDLLHSSRNNVILGGCAFLRLGKKKIGTGVDLKNLKLDYINSNKEYIEIGAMTPLRTLEMSTEIQNLSDGILSKAIAGIVGVPFRNTVTIGGTIYGKYGFSDVITALLAMDAELTLHKGGLMSIERFLNEKHKKDILVSLRLPIKKNKATYIGFRHSGGDFPILTIATTNSIDGFKIAVGARPMGAVLAINAMNYISSQELSSSSIEIATKLAIDELVFGSNMRATANYRRELARTLLERSLLEVCDL